MKWLLNSNLIYTCTICLIKIFNNRFKMYMYAKCGRAQTETHRFGICVYMSYYDSERLRGANTRTFLHLPVSKCGRATASCVSQLNNVANVNRLVNLWGIPKMWLQSIASVHHILYRCLRCG